MTSRAGNEDPGADDERASGDGSRAAPSAEATASADTTVPTETGPSDSTAPSDAAAASAETATRADTEARATPSRGPRPMRTFMRLVALLVLLGVFGTWYWLESPRGTEWLRSSLETWGSSMVGAPLRIASLEVDLVPFRARLEGVTIAPEDPGTATSATVEVITVELSTLGLLQRRVEVTDLELVRPRIQLVIPTLRLRGPVTEVVDAVGPVSIDLRRVRLVDGELSWLHRVTRIDGAVTGVSVTIGADDRTPVDGGRRGRLRIADGRIDLSARTGSTSLVTPVVLEARFAPHRGGISVEAFRAEIGSSLLEGGGEIRGTGTADLDLRGDVAVRDVFAFWRPPVPEDHGGRIAFDGTLQLRDGSPLIAGAVSGQALRLSGLDLDRFRADVQLRAAAIALRNVDIDLLGGLARGELIVDRSESPTTTRFTYELEGLDAARVTRWETLPGWRFAGTAAGAGEASWSGADLTSVSGGGFLEIDVIDLSFPRPVATPGMAGTVASSPNDAAGSRTPSSNVPALPLPARGRIEYEIRGGRLQIDTARLSLPGTELTASGRVDPDGELLVFARAESSDLRMLDHLGSQLRGFLRGEPVSRFGIAGRGRIDLRLAGRSDRPTIGGSLAGERLRVQDVEMGRFEATLRSEGQWLHAEDLRIAGSTGSASGTARLRLRAAETEADDDYDLTVSLRGFGLSMDLPLPPRDQPLIGRADGELTIRGRYGAPVDFDIDVEIDEPTLGGQPLGRAEAVAVRRDRVWTLDRLAVDGLGGSILATGEIHPANSVVVADVRLTGIDLAEALPLIPVAGVSDLQGRATGRVEVDGALHDLSGAGSLRIDRAVWRDLPLGRVSAALRIERGVVAAVAGGGPEGVSFLDLPLPRAPSPGALPSLPDAAGRWFLAATLDPHTPAHASVQGRAPVELAAEIGRRASAWIPESLALSGEIEGRASGPLSDVAEWGGQVTATGLVAEQNGARLLHVDRIAATLENGTLALDAELESDSSRLVAAPRWSLRSGTLDGSIHGDVELAALEISDTGAMAGGRLELDVTLAGTARQPLLEGRAAVRGGRLITDGPYEVTALTADLALGDGEIRLENLRGKLGATDFSANGAIPVSALLARSDETGEWRLTVDNLPLRPLLERSDAVSRLFGDGRLSADVELRGRGLDWRAYRGEVSLRSLLLRAGEYRIRLPEQARLIVESGRLRAIQELRLRGTRTDLGVTGDVDPATGDLDVHARGLLGLEPLNVLSPNWGIGGQLEVDLNIAGTLPDPTYDGTGRLIDALLSPPPLRQPLESVDGTMSFENRRVRFQDIDATFGGGGVAISGEVFLRDSLPQSFRYTIDIERALLRLESDVRARISGRLVHDGTPVDSLLSAQIEVEEGLYRRPWEADQAILELLAAPETDPDPLLSAIDLDLRVQGADGFLVDNNLADVEIDADYNIRGTAADPIVLGRSAILSGRLFWGANAFEVVQGVVEFNNPFETEPVFEIRARTAIRRYTVDLTFSGSLQRGVSFSYSSTPPLSDLDLFNLLALGEEPDSEVLRDSYGAAVGLQATRYLASRLFAEVERGAQRAFGLDRFLISPTLQGTETDATARFTVGKRINRSLYVTYSRLISTSEDQLLTVEYQVSPEVRVTGTREEDGSFGLDFLVQKRIR